MKSSDGGGRSGGGSGDIASTSPPCASRYSPAAVSRAAIVVSDPQLLSRLLYPNPVCLLTAAVLTEDVPDASQSPGRFNVMVITWLTPVDNAGNIFLSMNRNRYTASLLSPGSIFVLNVPPASMEDKVMSIGKCSGRDGDKFSSLDITTCAPGWCSDRSEYEGVVPPKVLRKYKDIAPHIAVSGCVAHMVCRLNKIEAQDNDGGHLFLFAEILYAFVRPEYWNGKCFIGQAHSREDVGSTVAGVSNSSLDGPIRAEPLLTFLGSGRFGHMIIPHDTQDPGDTVEQK